MMYIFVFYILNIYIFKLMRWLKEILESQDIIASKGGSEQVKL